MVTYSYTAPGGITKVTVGANGTQLQAGRYDIVAYGGGGGTGVIGATAPNVGGKGAEAGGYFVLQAGEKLEIIAAGAGGSSPFGGGGGGGASQVFAYINGRYVPLLVAGGGGGGGFLLGKNGRDATVGAPYGSGTGGSYGGTAGLSGAGGAGVTSGGGSGVLVKGGADAASGGAGGVGGSHGGFGGGGAGGGGGGGGGGYTGGNGGGGSGGYAGGDGGTSFISAAYGAADAAHTKAGIVTGAGKVVFEPAPICFAAGTLIRVLRDGAACDVPVEDLRIGDFAITASEGTRPIRWLGHRTLDLSRRLRPHEAQPIRIAAHAFGVGRPQRDLCLSPGHPVLVGADEDGAGGYLVPIICLINGTTIARMKVESITYWHVELDAHDVLLAENLAAESYLDWGDRAFFTEGPEHVLQNPDFVAPGLGGRCRPVAEDGSIVEAERRRLDAVLSRRLHAASSWPSYAVSAC